MNIKALQFLLHCRTSLHIFPTLHQDPDVREIADDFMTKGMVTEVRINTFNLTDKGDQYVRALLAIDPEDLE